jgi:hypothetical protein
VSAATVVSLLMAALVSAVVALSVEWAAKPRLEARKERLLTIERARTQLWRGLHQMMFNAARLASLPASGPDEDAQAAHEAVVPATYELEAAFMEATGLGGHYREETVEVLASYVGAARGLMVSNRSCDEEGRLLRTWTAALMDVLGGPGQPWLYRLRPRWRRYRVLQLAELQRMFAAGSSNV